MLRLSDIYQGMRIYGDALGQEPVTVVAVEPHGEAVLMLTYRTTTGALGDTMLYSYQEQDLFAAGGSEWTFDADPDTLKLAAEAYRIHLAHLFDPYLAVRTSAIEPLPHQISAVYQYMLPKLPLRCVLADDPGAGKTIMAGLLIKEMLARSDLKRCLIVSPGNLAEQWQDELWRKFRLRFTILTNDLLEAAVTRNAFAEHDLCIARLDKLSRSEDVQALLRQVRWDLVVVDEAHKMSATVFGREVKYTKRYRLGQLLGDTTENLLLMTATPHDGKPKDFQLFMALVDRDRFAGAAHRRRRHNTAQKALSGVQADLGDLSDVIRRLVKEELLKFDGRPLFPERRAYTVTYELDCAEADLYADVTEYVTNEFNRADRLDGRRKNSVGFALTILQRRLASSPEAIYQSLKRRRERLERRLSEVRDKQNRAGRYSDLFGAVPDIDDEFDEDDYTDDELEGMENNFADSATASATASELETEITILRRLERKANDVRQSGEDRKWEELSRLLQDNAEMFDPEGRREKLIVFTEHKDTLEYLATRIRQLLGSHDTVITIRGGMTRDERHRVEELFRQDKEVRVLVATDAAGEGINLQRAHLMVNYDLPWNPNRIEQRFGRIHRIGQIEVCHLWNLVAKETREGQVFERLFQKLEEERQALGGRVFDILGQVTFGEQKLSDLLVKAIRYGDDPEVRDRLNQVVDSSLDTDALRRLLSDYALTSDVMDAATVAGIKEQMERMEARKLEPHFIEAFFLEAMQRLGGRMGEREHGRYEVADVPLSVRSRRMRVGVPDPVLASYERVCFEKDRVRLPGNTVAADLVCPGHPLLDTLVAEVLDRDQKTLRQGAVLMDDDPAADTARLLFWVESAVEDGTRATDGSRRVVDRQVHFVECDYDGNARDAGWAPYLDYRAPTKDEVTRMNGALAEELGFLERDPEGLAKDYAIREIIPGHVREVTRRIRTHADKVQRAVERRLKAEVEYWDNRAWELKQREDAGKPNRKQSSAYAERRAGELAGRLETRVRQLDEQRRLSPVPPRVVGAALVVPAALLRDEDAPEPNQDDPAADAQARRGVELAAMDTVTLIEQELGYFPHNVSATRGIGYDIESKVPRERQEAEGCALRLIEVKGRAKGADTVALSKNEVLAALNKPECWLLAIVEVDGHNTRATYLRRPNLRTPAFTETSVTYDIGRLTASAEVVLERNDIWR